MIEMNSEAFNIEKIRSKKFRDFYIIHRSGYSIYHRAYVKSKIDDALLSGFLTAIFTFSEELSMDNIKVMDMKDFKFIYEKKNVFIFILSVLNDVDLQFGKVILAKIISYFDGIYNELEDKIKLNENELADTLIDSDFGSKIDDIVKNALLEQYMNSPSHILEEIESFLISLFGTMGKDIIEDSIKKVCSRKDKFNLEHLDGLIQQIKESLSKKMNSNQVKQIIKQIKETFSS